MAKNQISENSAVKAAVKRSKKGVGAKLRSKRSAADAKKPKSGLPPTPEQQEILDLLSGVKRGTVVVIEAGAGTGKTTTLRMIADVMKGRGQYTAFNTSLTKESAQKFRNTRVSCNTTHSLAFRAEGKRFAQRLDGVRVRSYEIAKMLGIKDLEMTMGKRENAQPITKRLSKGWLAAQVMGAIKRFCQSADPVPSENHFRYVDGIDLPAEGGRRTYTNNQKLREHLVPFAVKAWADLSDPDGRLPFSHDHYVKVWQLNKPVISANYILLDESQDTAEVMLDVLKQQQKATVILVGDSAQQIYEWRGAVNAMSAFPKAPRKYLSQSFRFGPAIAAVANRVLETLEEPTQLRLKGLPTIASRIDTVEEPDCILCRTNAVAIASVLQALDQDKRPYLVGGGASMIRFMEAVQALQQGQSTDHPELACFNSWPEVQEYSHLDEGEDLKLLVKLIDEFGVDTILGALRAMPAEKDADIVVSTAHKSKGREWNSVRLAPDFPTESKCSDADRRLLYVAVTRAKLVLDVSDCPFFTGDDSLDISQVISNQHAPAEPVTPPTPSAPPENAEFTWSKYEDQWCARGPAGYEGKEVELVRRDGSRSKRRLGAAVKSFHYVTLYKIN